MEIDEGLRVLYCYPCLSRDEARKQCLFNKYIHMIGIWLNQGLLFQKLRKQNS